jgi:adenylyl-sulfate kinase
MANSSIVLWFTGMSGAGKTTIAENTSAQLSKKDVCPLILDGDAIRGSLHKHLSFSKEDIMENNRLISELCAQKMADYDVIIVPIISPYKISRDKARKTIGPNFFEIYIETPLDTLIKRDSKGLYQKSLEGKIDNLIGFSKTNIYEKPENPDLTISTNNQSIEESVSKLMIHIQQWMD